MVKEEDRKTTTAATTTGSRASSVSLLVCSAVLGIGAGVGLYFWNRTKRNRTPWRRGKGNANKGVMTKTQVDLLEGYEGKCVLTKKQMEGIIEDFLARMEEGLEREEQQLKMLPSFVEKMPCGKEEGEFLAIDLGGTNSRVVRLALKGGQVREMVAHEDPIPKELMVGTTKELFDFIARQVKTFLGKHNTLAQSGQGKGGKIPIGFCFSYPMKQTGLANGEIVNWNKGFDIKDTFGKDLVELLEGSLSEYKIQGKVFAMVNDTVGTLAAHKFIDQDTQLGVILGTGSNAAYIEGKRRITKLQGGETKREEDKMIVNIEWGNFKSSRLPYLEEDREVDERTPNKGKQHFEKMISGMYLGEMVRLACLRASAEGNLFGGSQKDKLQQAWTFPTSLVSRIDGLGPEKLDQVKKELSAALDIPRAEITHGCARFVSRLCQLVGDRSAALAATGVTAIYRYLMQSKQVSPNQRFVVAVDGGLFEHYPRYPERMQQTFISLLGKEQAKRVELVHSPDGSGIGTAVIAAATAR
ncbi:hexokinase [Chloropicon primus]|uniref:Phosphotransferase n=1 Tax=Chloropicon primus TaxID=1764295 RepID=A0A5B8MG48_9CHLO|nr:hexokinase [Chloropicon primus]UPQ97844.1 hexokinase [Chloropicon primus]|eukprot:QDZ18635.1 hexokinase [Chloropicon primus]